MTEPSYTSTIHPPATPPKKKGWRIRHIAAAYGIGGLILGSALAAAAQGEPETVTVTKEVPGPERIVEKEKRVEVPVTPQSCLTALTLNEEAFTGLATSMQLVMDADYSGAKANNDKVSALVPKVNAAKSECRASVK
jgi:hypothetical protein